VREPLYTLTARPQLHDPVVILFLEGWIDAGGAGALAASRLHEMLEDEVRVASFDTDELLDLRAHRPMMQIDSGVVSAITWPALELVSGRIDDRDVMLLIGPEPDHLWRSFSDDIVELFERFEVDSVIGLGAYPAATPHTRPVRLSATASRAEMTEGYVNASAEVPAGIHAVIEQNASQRGIDAVGIWAQVPHYAAGALYPAAAAELVRHAGSLASFATDTSELDGDAMALRASLDERVEGHPEHSRLLAELERTYDHLVELDDSSGEDLAAELEDFLRDPDGDTYPAPIAGRLTTCEVVKRPQKHLR
jgi:hypothetical protein